eukprot:16068-Prymnesium_polylepis.1
MRAARFTARDLKSEGHKARYLRKAGFSAKEVLTAGFYPEDIKAAYTGAELKKEYTAKQVYETFKFTAPYTNSALVASLQQSCWKLVLESKSS